MDKKKVVIRRLKDEGFKMTPQRAAIIDFLLDNENHPCAEEIYKGIKTEYPMVSFSTVYNTLRILERIGFLKSLNITENRVNFDPETSPHHHLFCERCGRIVDVQLDADVCLRKKETVRVNSVRIYLYGICSDCLRKEGKKTI